MVNYNFRNLIWPTLQAIKSLGGSGSNDEIVAKVIEMEKIPEADQSVLHKDGRTSKIAYNISWGRTFLKKMGAINNSERSIWSITSVGEKMSNEEVIHGISRINKDDRNNKNKNKEREDANVFSEENKQDNSTNDLTKRNIPKHDIINQDGSIEDDWREQLLSVIRNISPEAFEKLAQRILRESGFIKVVVTGRSGDGGIDGQGILKMNLLSFQVFFQCKKYKDQVGPGAVRDFRGAMQGRGDKGLLITTGSFTSSARQEATRDGAPAIDLIDGYALCELLKNLKLGVCTELVEKVSVKQDFFTST